MNTTRALTDAQIHALPAVRDALLSYFAYPTDDRASAIVGAIRAALAATGSAPAEPAPTSLLNCPFCGSTADIACVDSTRGEGPIYVHCDNCGADGPQHEWEGDAKAGWNKRAALSAPASIAAPDHADHVPEIAIRLRRLARAAGRPNCVPEDDTLAVGAIFTVLGSIAGAMERSAAPVAAAERSLRSEAQRDAVMRASGFGSLLSEIMGCGALRDYDELRDRVSMAVEDHEASLAAIKAPGAAT